MNDSGRIKTRITISFGLIIALLVVIVSVNTVQLTQIANHLDKVVATHNVQMTIMNNILDLARQRSLILQHMLIAEDPFLIDEQMLAMSKTSQQYSQLSQKLRDTPITTEERALLQQQQRQTARTGQLQHQVLQHVLDHDYDKARRLFYDEAIPSQILAMNLMQQFIKLQHGHNRAELASSVTEAERDRNHSLILLVTGVMLSLLIAAWVSRRLHVEIERRNKLENELEQRVEKRTRQLEHLSRHDALTGLPNRSAFERHLVRSLLATRNNNTRLALMFMDLDGFKQINDDYGHATGDKILMEVAQRFRSAVANSGFLSRVGGDEFTVILQNPGDEKTLSALGKRIIDEINRDFHVENTVCNVGVSLGVAYSDGEHANTDELLTLADNAMYAAKRAGKNCLVFDRP